MDTLPTPRMPTSHGFAAHPRYAHSLGIQCPPQVCPQKAAGCPGPLVPVVENSVDHHPLRLYPIAIESFLHLCKLRVFVLSFPALLFVPTKVPRRRLIHIILPLIVSEHHLTVQLQLPAENKTNHQGAAHAPPSIKLAPCPLPASHLCQVYLQFRHPGAVPVRHALPFHKELPLWPPLQGLGRGSVGVSIWRPRHWGRRWWLTPLPDQDLLNFALKSWTLRKKLDQISNHYHWGGGGEWDSPHPQP